MKTKDIFKNILFSSIIVFIFFVGLELFQRAKYYINTKDESYLFFGATNLELRFARHFNRHAKESKDPQIVIVGGSTVLGDGLPKEMAWPEQMEAICRELGYNITVYNLGEGGSDSSKDVDRLRSYMKKHKPSAVIFYTGINDAVLLESTKAGRLDALSDMINAGLLDRLNAFLLKRSLFYTNLKEKIAKVMTHNINAAYRPKKIRAGREGTFDSSRIDGLASKRLRDNVMNAIGATITLGIPMVIGSPPVATPSEDPYRMSYDILRTEMGNISREFA